MSGSQKVACQTVAGFLFSSGLRHGVLCFLKVEPLETVYRIVMVKALRKQGEEVYPKQ